jgi:hypothetical protein
MKTSSFSISLIQFFIILFFLHLNILELYYIENLLVNFP